MFYDFNLLGKRSALGKVWEYAHKSSQLSRREVSMVDIDQSIRAIEDPLAPMALRAQGQLLYGVCRVYDGKTKVLMEDAQHAQSKLISIRISQSSLSLHSKRAAADQSINHIMAPSAAISLGDRDDFEPNQALNQSINAAFDDFSSHDFDVRLSMSQARLSEINQSMNQSLLHDISLEQARGTQSAHQAINQSMRFDEFEISGGGFSIDDDLDDALLNQSNDQSVEQVEEQPAHIEPDMYEDQSMIDQSAVQDQDHHEQDAEQAVDQSMNQSIQIEVARDAEVELARRSVGAILGLDATDLDIDMDDLDPILRQSMNQSVIQPDNQLVIQVDQAESPKPRPAKRVKVVQFRLEEDSSARLSDAELKRRLADPSDLTESRADQSINQSASRRRIAPNVLSTLMHSSVFSAGHEDPLDSFMAELFSVQGMRAAPLSEEEEQQANDQSVNHSMNEHDVSRLSNMSDLVGGDFDFGLDEQQVDQQFDHQVDEQVEHQVDHIDEIADHSIDQSIQQASEPSSFDINEPPIFDTQELVENDRIQREQSRLTHQFFSEPQLDQEDDEPLADAANNQVDTADFGTRSRKVLEKLNVLFEEDDSPVEFDTLLADRRNPKIASSLFYQLLVLSQKQAVKCEQDSWKGEAADTEDWTTVEFPVLTISKGRDFDQVRTEPVVVGGH